MPIKDTICWQLVDPATNKSIAKPAVLFFNSEAKVIAIRYIDHTKFNTQEYKEAEATFNAQLDHSLLRQPRESIPKAARWRIVPNNDKSRDTENSNLIEFITASAYPEYERVLAQLPTSIDYPSVSLHATSKNHLDTYLNNLLDPCAQQDLIEIKARLTSSDIAWQQLKIKIATGLGLGLITAFVVKKLK
jgi:hypothetical protein